MRVGIDARLSYHQPAGISRYTKHLIEELAQLDRETSYTVFQHRKQREPLTNAPNFHRRTLFTPVHTRVEQPMLAAELSFHTLDLLHSTDFIPPLRSRVPSVITVHDLAFLRWPHFLTESHAAYYSQIDRAVSHARHIIVPSESTKRDVVKQLGASAKKISVIYEAAAPHYVPLMQEECLTAMQRKYGIPEKYIFFVSTIEPRKNIGGLLEAFHHLRKYYGGEDTGLVLAGKPGWLYEEVYRKVEQLDLGQSTFFLGRVPDEDLHQLFVGARCHAHPAYYEGFGLSPLEAMACGTPTIVSNTSSMPEVVGDAGLIIDPSDWEEIAVAMHRLLTEDELHKELSQKGLQRASVFSWSRAASETLDVYRMVCDRTSVPAAPAHHSSA
ncbi:MAG: glycosyltransferase family 4 protein [Caldilineaceae bacterium SB0664_bin_27]|uniref:Glycosyltransferase family 4 protein n=1 Tax=Caldilineaceae bacterium SB0664_bin_27 TaxID=2605260 RepID=A0A6B0YTK4_9CHLR|nr:glycosyltransferase family 4 protein [Caldilineaceae bacterium SB0664_bin_27]